MSETENTGLSIVANRYADAMTELAESQNMLDSVDSELRLIKETISSCPDLKKFLEHPLVSREDKKDTLQKIFGQHISSISMNLVKLVTDRNRLVILPLISDYYNKILCKKRNIETAEVITAIPVDEEILNKTREKLENLFKRNIRIESKIDKEIIAGMIVKIGDKIIDGSIKTRLETMKKQLC